MSLCIVGFEHCIKDPLQVADLIGRMDRSQLRYGIAGSIDNSVDAGASRLVISASNFEIEGGDSVVGGSNMGVEVSLGNVFDECLTSV